MMRKLASMALAVVAVGLVAAAPAKQPVKQKATALTVRSYFDAGGRYFDAAADTVKNATGIDLVVEEAVKDDWQKGPAIFEQADVLKGLLAGEVIATGVRRLTAAEKAKGLEERVLGYFGAVLVVHHEGPLSDLKSTKWKKVMARKSMAGLKWSDLGDVAAKDDGPVSWSLPDASAAEWALTMQRLGAFPPAAIKDMKPKTAVDPLTAAHATGADKGLIAVHGFDFVVNSLAHPLLRTKLLAVDGVAPITPNLENGTYPFAQPVVAVFSTKAAAEANSPVAKVVKWLDSPRAADVARIRALARHRG